MAAELAKSQTQHNTQIVEEDVEMDGGDDYLPIDKLTTQGINQGDIKKIKEAGYYTVQALTMHTKKELCNVKGISEAKVDKMLEAARKLLPGMGFVSGTIAMQRRQQQCVKISTGCAALNDILGGGIETMAITEIHGEYRTGKTQICHTLCVTCQLPIESGGGAGKVAYVDTEGTFRPERVKAIAARYSLDPDAVLENVVFARAHTWEHQMDLLVHIAALMAEEPFKCLIVDSLMGVLRTDFTGRGELSERQQMLGKMLARLKKLANEFNVAVVVTNQVISDPSGGAVFVSDPKKPIGGHVLAHAATVRVALRKGKGEQRLAKVIDAPNLPEAEASFALADGGVADFKE